MIFAARPGELSLAVPLGITCALTFVARGVAGGARDAFLEEERGAIFSAHRHATATAERVRAGAEAVGAHKTSMLVDIEHGRAIELEALVGSVIELARITNTPTPLISAIYAVTQLLAHTLDKQQGRLRVEPR